jgi:hypothetical protein
MMEGGGWLSSCVCIWSSWAVIVGVVVGAVGAKEFHHGA